MTSLKTALSLVLLIVLSLGAFAQEDGIDTRSLLKLNLSDWYWARYELGYEHVRSGGPCTFHPLFGARG